MIEQIYVGDKIEIIYSIEEACELVRNNYSEELGSLLLHTFDRLMTQSEKDDKEYEKLRCEAENIREQCEEDAAIAESKVTTMREDIENIIDFTIEYMDIPDEERKILVDALEKAIEV